MQYTDNYKKSLKKITAPSVDATAVNVYIGC